MQHVTYRERLKTKTGCMTCRRRRKKCDDVRPLCGICKRLGLHCLWAKDNSLAAAEDTIQSSSDAEAGRPSARATAALVSFRGSYLPVQVTNWLTFDHPSILKATPTSCLINPSEKQVYQYIFLKGDQVMTIHKKNLKPPSNIFSLGLFLIGGNPSLRYAYLAVGAAHLHPAQHRVSLPVIRYYQRSLLYLREELARTDTVQPSEAACATAGVLAIYEVRSRASLSFACVFFVKHGGSDLLCMIWELTMPGIQMSISMDPRARMTHFLGYAALVQLKCEKDPYAWGPTRLTLELYIHLFAVSSTFFGRDAVKDKSIGYLDYLIGILNAGPRILGPNIAGVPPHLLSIVYKISWLRHRPKDVREYPVELSGVAKELKDAQPKHNPDVVENWKLEEAFMEKLYYSACCILLRRTMDRQTSANDPFVIKHVRDALEALSNHESDQTPQICVCWPLVIIGLAVQNADDLDIVRKPIVNLVEGCGLIGLTSALNFLDRAWSGGPLLVSSSEDTGASHSGGNVQSYLGLDALSDDELLRTVHI